MNSSSPVLLPQAEKSAPFLRITVGHYRPVPIDREPDPATPYPLERQARPVAVSPTVAVRAECVGQLTPAPPSDTSDTTLGLYRSRAHTRARVTGICGCPVRCVRSQASTGFFMSSAHLRQSPGPAS